MYFFRKKITRLHMSPFVYGGLEQTDDILIATSWTVLVILVSIYTIVIDIPVLLSVARVLCNPFSVNSLSADYNLPRCYSATGKLLGCLLVGSLKCGYMTLGDVITKSTVDRRLDCLLKCGYIGPIM